MQDWSTQPRLLQFANKKLGEEKIVPRELKSDLWRSWIRLRWWWFIYSLVKKNVLAKRIIRNSLDESALIQRPCFIHFTFCLGKFWPSLLAACSLVDFLLTQCGIECTLLCNTRIFLGNMKICKTKKIHILYIWYLLQNIWYTKLEFLSYAKTKEKDGF